MGLEHNHGLTGTCSRLQNIEKRGGKGIDATTQILKIDQQHIEGRQHGRSRPARVPVETEYRDTEARVDPIGRLDHIVLFVAAHPMLGPECRHDVQVRGFDQGIQRMPEVRTHRGWMSQKSHAAALTDTP